MGSKCAQTSKVQVWRFLSCSQESQQEGEERPGRVLLKGEEGSCLLGLDSSHIQEKGQCQNVVWGCRNLDMLGH